MRYCLGFLMVASRGCSGEIYCLGLLWSLHEVVSVVYCMYIVCGSYGGF